MREAFFSKKREEYITFVKEGYKYHLSSLTYQTVVRAVDYIDDMYNRLEWLRNSIKNMIVWHEINLALAGCNITIKGNGPAIKFINEHVNEVCVALPEDVIEEIHEKVLEMNPSWSGEFDRTIGFLRKKFNLELPESNFKDLALRPSSAYHRSTSYLSSLIGEIKRDVFDNVGLIQRNVPVDQLGGHEYILKKTVPPLENIILYCSHNSNITKNSYIGVLEHGNFQVRVIAKRAGFDYWDTTPEEIVETLRTAIKWWKGNILTWHDREAMAQAVDDEESQGYLDEFKSDLRDFGYDDDDF